jgi:hypothetical protein
MIVISPSKYIKKISGYSWTFFGSKYYMIPSDIFDEYGGKFLYFRGTRNNGIYRVELGMFHAAAVTVDDKKRHNMTNVQINATYDVAIIGIGRNYKEAVEFGYKVAPLFRNHKLIPIESINHGSLYV